MINEQKIQKDFDLLVIKLLHACKTSNIGSALQLNALMATYVEIDKDLTKEIDSTINN